MDFARKQLEKYGWSDGKGLGKNENGMAEALKPKIKRSVAGIGHDAAADFTEHWWTQLYDKAAGNVEVEYKDGKTKKIKTKDTNEFEITNSTWKIKKKRKKMDNEEQYADYFVRKAVLTNGGRQMEKMNESEDTDSEDGGEGGGKKDVLNMTDEELFAACGGRTAHKGARHGLKATGKLARIAQQEQMLLTQSQYEGYSHAKRKKAEILSNDMEYFEVRNHNRVESLADTKKQKKKNKSSAEAESKMCLPANCEKNSLQSVASVNETDDVSRKSKKSRIEETVVDEELGFVEFPAKAKKKKRNKKSENIVGEQDNFVTVNNINTEVSVKKTKKKKLKQKDD